MKVQNGMFVKDVITEFEGVVVAVAEFWNGCNKVLILPKRGTDMKQPENSWVDVSRVEVQKACQIADLPWLDIAEPRVTGFCNDDV